ncbi:hypothetical protein NHJ13051_007055 [Beauveria bassiana]
MKYLVIAAAAYASLMATATAAPTADVVAACRSTIDDVFNDDNAKDDSAIKDKRNFCAEIIGGYTLDVSAKDAQLAPRSIDYLHQDCDADNTLKLACQEITATTPVAACRSTIDDVFDDDDAEDDSAIEEKRNFCAEIISGNTLDVSAKNARLPLWSIKSLHDDCDADNTLKLACQEITVAVCRSTIDGVFFDNDSDVKSDVDGKRNFCADIIGGNTLDVSAKNAQLAPWSIKFLHNDCDADNTLKSACQDIASAAAVAGK